MIRIYILNDNRSRGRLFACEHGLSVLAQWGSESALLDFGQTDTFARNARLMGLDLADVGTCILSHGHYDHSGGLHHLPPAAAPRTLFTGPGATIRRYSLSTAMLKPNGMPRPDDLRDFNLRTVSGILHVSDSLTLFTLPDDAPANPHLVVDAPGGQHAPDTFADELFALIRHGQTSLLYGGCTHHGLPQLLGFCRDSLHLDSLTAFVGGLHLSGRTPDEVRLYADQAERIMHVDRWIVNHCTGTDAVDYWARRFGSSPSDGFAGSIVDIG